MKVKRIVCSNATVPESARYEQAEALKKAILAAGKEPRPYNDMGRYVVGLDVPGPGSAFEIGRMMGASVPSPMYLGGTLYWPALPWAVPKKPKAPSHATPATPIKDLSKKDLNFLIEAMTVAMLEWQEQAKVEQKEGDPEDTAQNYRQKADTARWFADLFDGFVE
jgi:hypothetical protein